VAHVSQAGFGTIQTSRDSLIMLSRTDRVRYGLFATTNSGEINGAC
jgi:hypothetical protein